MNKLIGILTLGLCLNTFAQNITEDENPNSPPLDFSARSFSEKDFQSYAWLKEFEIIIVVNKASEGSDKQSLRLYQNGKLKEYSRISSGRESFEKGCAVGQSPRKDHCSNRAYWSTTPTGYFDVDKLVENYFSNLWQTWMPFAIFFTDGIALHQAPAGTETKLGKRASGGCIRLHPSMAPIVYTYVQKASKGLVPQFDRSGEVKKTAHGDIIRWQGYKTLVIVQNIIQ